MCKLWDVYKRQYYKYPDIKDKTSFVGMNRERLGNSHESYNVIFNDQQNKILSYLEYQLNDYDDCNQRLAIIQGKPETGKSCVINEIVRRINSYFGCDATLLMEMCIRDRAKVANFACSKFGMSQVNNTYKTGARTLGYGCCC